MTPTKTKTDADRAIARARAYAIAGEHLLNYRPSKTETEVEYDERYKPMNHLLDRAIALHPAPTEMATFNPNYPNDAVMRP